MESKLAEPHHEIHNQHDTSASAVHPCVGISLSKNAQKKAAKAERYAAQKLERRTREREAKKRKKLETALKRRAGALDTEEEESARQKKKKKLHFGGTVVIDLGFDEKMNDKEISSLCSQLAYTYSANRNASFPFSLVFTSVNGRTLTRLESLNSAGYKRWANTKWQKEGYEQLWSRGNTIHSSGDIPFAVSSKPLRPPERQPVDASTESKNQISYMPSIEVDARTNVVYLTADAHDELVELKSDEIYIIGGICDHNRYKNLCLIKATESGVRTARLPIGRYLAALSTRKVLTVNQVFEILLAWVDTKDWEKTFYSVIPKRKFQVAGKYSTMDSGADIAGEADENDSDVDQVPESDKD